MDYEINDESVYFFHLLVQLVDVVCYLIRRSKTRKVLAHSDATIAAVILQGCTQTYLTVPFIGDPGYLNFLATHGSNFESPSRKPVTSTWGGSGQKCSVVEPVVSNLSVDDDLEQWECG